MKKIGLKLTKIKKMHDFCIINNQQLKFNKMKKQIFTALLSLTLVFVAQAQTETNPHRKINIGLTLGSVTSISNTDANRGFDLNLNFAFIPHKRIYTFLDMGMNGIFSDAGKEYSALLSRTSLNVTKAEFSPQVGLYINIGAGYIFTIQEKLRIIPALAISNNVVNPFQTENFSYTSGTETYTITYEVPPIGKTTLMPTLKMDFPLTDWLLIFGNVNLALMRENGYEVKYTETSSTNYNYNQQGTFKTDFGMSFISTSLGLKLAF
jgi:hypothetical protein